jgi:hypothetical protein
VPVGGIADDPGLSDPFDRNGEPCESDMGCLIMLFALGGICVVSLGAFLGLFAASGC